jgi:hypothetical protein
LSVITTFRTSIPQSCPVAVNSRVELCWAATSLPQRRLLYSRHLVTQCVLYLYLYCLSQRVWE